MLLKMLLLALKNITKGLREKTNRQIEENIMKKVTEW